MTSYPALKLKPTSPKTCLLVDDYAPLRFELARILRDKCGIDTREAQDGERAIAILEQRSFDLIVADQKMPGPSGIELLAVCCERWPAMLRVLLSGRTRAEYIDAGVADLVLDKMQWPRDVAAEICRLATEGRP